MKETGWLMLVGAALLLGGCASHPKTAGPLQTTAIEPRHTSQQPPSASKTEIAANTHHSDESVAPPAPRSNDVSANASPVQSRNQVVARLSGKPITMDQLLKPLMDGYGLNILLNMVQLEYAKQQAAEQNISVTPADVEHERDYTFAKLFPDSDKADYPQLFSQLLEQKHVSAAEFNMVLETNAYLRKIAEPLLVGKINDAALEEAFKQLYGETVQIRVIQLANMQEVTQAKQRIASGEPFEKVAQAMSRSAETAPLGGELPPFSRSAAYPQVLKDVAFALKKGEVSDAVQFNNAYWIVKMDERFAPKAVKFEDVKESLRADLLDRLVQQMVSKLRSDFAQQAIQALVIDEPTLKQQYDDKIHQRDQQITNRNAIRERYERERNAVLQAATQRSTTAPVEEPSTSQPSAPDLGTPAMPSAPAPEVARPPATQSGAATGGASD